MSIKYEIKNIVGTFNPSKLQKLASHVLESGHLSPRYCTSQVDVLSASTEFLIDIAQDLYQ